MAGYPKIWTTLWSSPTFRALSGPERGVLMQLILWCKHERDDGYVLAESWTKLGLELGFSRQTAFRVISKLDSVGYVKAFMCTGSVQNLVHFGQENTKSAPTLSKTVPDLDRVGTKNTQTPSKPSSVLDDSTVQYGRGQLVLFLPAYKESQQLTAKDASKRARHWPGNPSNMDAGNPTSRADQSRADQSRAVRTATNPEIEIRTQNIREIINHSEFQLAVGHQLPDPIGWVRRMVEKFREPAFPDDQVERGLESLFEHQQKHGWPVPRIDKVRAKVWDWIERQVDNRSTAENQEDEFDRICREHREQETK